MRNVLTHKVTSFVSSLSTEVLNQLLQTTNTKLEKPLSFFENWQNTNLSKSAYLLSVTINIFTLFQRLWNIEQVLKIFCWPWHSLFIVYPLLAKQLFLLSFLRLDLCCSVCSIVSSSCFAGFQGKVELNQYGKGALLVPILEFYVGFLFVVTKKGRSTF